MLATGLVVDDAIVVIENIARHIREGERDARRAASAAMREVTGAVIATTLVLVAVFVPVALFPGTTGILYRQFALTIAFSLAISSFNALTLTPALSALLLGRGEPTHGWFFSRVDRIIEGSTRAYVNGLTRFLGHRRLAVALFLAGMGLTYFVYQQVPRAFVPDEDQGWGMLLLQAPEGASLGYTARVAEQVQEVLMGIPEVDTVFSVSGFSFSGLAPNRGMMFFGLDPYSERPRQDQSAQAVIQRLWGQLGGITGAIAIPFLPPVVQGLGIFGGFEYVLQDQGGAFARRAGAGDPADRARGQCGRLSERPLHGLHRQRPAARRQHRPREGQGSRRAALGDHPDASGVRRLDLRQRL